MLQWSEYLRIPQKQSMLQPLMVEPLLEHSILIIIVAMTGRAEAIQTGSGIVDIMVTMRSMQVHGVAFPGSTRCPLPPMWNVTKFACPPCLLFTLSGECFPVLGILLSPFGLHHETPFARKVPKK